jgi:hypothetical protein
MKKKVWLFIVIGLLLTIGIGGKLFLDKQKDREVTREQKVEAERMSNVGSSAEKYFCRYKVYRI